MNPTNNPGITESQWFVNPANPLLEIKYFCAKKDDMVHIISARRGVEGTIPETEEVKSYQLENPKDYEDNSAAQLNKLIRFLEKPVA